MGKKITPLCSDASNLYKQPFGWVCNILTINGVVHLCKVVLKMKSEVFAWLISLIGVVLFCLWGKKRTPYGVFNDALTEQKKKFHSFGFVTVFSVVTPLS